MSLAFVSYRRHDSSAAARWLHRALQDTFGEDAAFMDRRSIRVADDWAERLETELANATLLIVVIGPSWLRIADEHGRRRLDSESDWVRAEIHSALARRIKILPVLLSRTPPPTREALPEAIAGLVAFQALDLRDESWEQDIQTLVGEVERLGFARMTADAIEYPRPQVTLAELTPKEIEGARRELTEWRLVESEVPGRPGVRRVELYRGYDFRSFEAAMKFMADATPYISKQQHHPRWENVWKTVNVWLTTWDIGQRPSELDIDLARNLDQLFARCEERA